MSLLRSVVSWIHEPLADVFRSLFPSLVTNLFPSGLPQYLEGNNEHKRRGYLRWGNELAETAYLAGVLARSVSGVVGTPSVPTAPGRAYLPGRAPPSRAAAELLPSSPLPLGEQGLRPE